MFTVYAIYNKKKEKIYIGQTEDIEGRLIEHNNGIFKNSYTSKIGGKWTLIYQEICVSRQKALLREKQLKSYQGRKFIKKHIPL